MRCAADRLARALRRRLADFDCAAAIETRSRPWASVTFTGERHVLTMRLAGTDADRATDMLLDGIEEREFDLKGHIVIEIAAASRTREAGAVVVMLEAVTVEAD